jgi:hypothetical protein
MGTLYKMGPVEPSVTKRVINQQVCWTSTNILQAFSMAMQNYTEQNGGV